MGRRSDARSFDRFHGFPAKFPGNEIFAIPAPGSESAQFSCVTVYAETPSRGIVGIVGGIVRVNLFAELRGIRNLIASAFVPLGFTGPVIAASGILADGWHITAQATDPRLELGIALRADSCCAEPKVLVPVPLQNFPLELDLEASPAVFFEIVEQAPAPWQIETGLWTIFTEVGGLTVNLLPGQRVRGLSCRAAAVDATIQITAPGTFLHPLITVPAGTTFALNPDGTLVGPGTIVFTDVEVYVVEVVR